jgi:hypothetical protein
MHSDSEPIDADGVQRWVPLNLWLAENARKNSIWRYGSPRLSGPENMSRWLKRHEVRLTQRGAVMRLGNAWRLIQPGFESAMFEILKEERERATGGR